MAASSVTLTAGAVRLADAHALAVPQKDNLCGPFLGALALRARLEREGYDLRYWDNGTPDPWEEREQ